MSYLCNVNGIANDASETYRREDNEVNKFLQPFRKLIANHEEFQIMRVEKSMLQRKEILNQVHAFQKNVSDIDKKTLERSTVISTNANFIKRILQEKNDSDCILVGHQFQKQVISVVEGLVDFTNNFPQSVEISCQTPATDGTEILVPLEDAVCKFDIVIAKCENSMETIIQCKDHFESMADGGGKSELE